MSKVAIEGNALGTGTLTIAAPNTNTNRTITLPDATGTLALTGAASNKIEEGNSKVEVTDAGTGKVEITVDAVEVADFTTGEIVFNETGANQDFRVEGDTDANLLFVDASTERVGIGTATPARKFNVEQTSSGEVVLFKTNAADSVTDITIANDAQTWGFRVDGINSDNFIIRNILTAQNKLTIATGGTITFNAYGAGTLSTNGSGVISASDGRYKTKTRLVDNGLEAIVALQPTYFKWNEDTPFVSEYEELGFIAQEVAAVIPEASPGEDQEGRYRNYHDRAIIAMLVKGMQELKAELDQAKTRIAALENNNA